MEIELSNRLIPLSTACEFILNMIPKLEEKYVINDWKVLFEEMKNEHFQNTKIINEKILNHKNLLIEWIKNLNNNSSIKIIFNF